MAATQSAPLRLYCLACRHRSGGVRRTDCLAANKMRYDESGNANTVSATTLQLPYRGFSRLCHGNSSC